MSSFLDLTGNKFGRLTCIKRVDHPETIKHGTYWLTKCSCGNEKTVSLGDLRGGGVTSCGCFRKEFRRVDLTGQIFGRLTCISHIVPENGRADKLYWFCKCSCGNEVITTTGNLRTGNAKSCSCLQKDIVSKLSTTHGKSNTSKNTGDAYYIWLGMRNRCNNPKSKDWEYYGGKGVKVCERWDSYELFEQDMGIRPTKEHSIDRRDSDLGYNPDNCYWATFKQQSDSIKYSKRWVPITINGIEYRSMSMAIKLLGITKHDARKLQKEQNYKII